MWIYLILVAFFFLLTVVFAVAWWRVRRRCEEAERALMQLDAVRREVERLEGEKRSLDEKCANLNNSLSRAMADNASISKQLEMVTEQAAKDQTEMRRQWDEQLKVLKTQFEVLSADILKRNAEELKTRNSEQMTNLIDPLKEKMKEFKESVDKSRTESIEKHASLEKSIEAMMKRSQEIGQEADNLASALRGGNKTQGNWGEMVLETILKEAGLVEGLHYESQTTLRDETGATLLSEEKRRRMVPDVIVHFPDGKDVVIDSKVSLNAYTDYINGESDEERRLALTRHIVSVRQHIKELSDKNYPAYIRSEKREAVEYALMFVSIEGAYELAIANAPDLWNEAFEKRVVVVSPFNLMALLRMIQMGWTRVDQERNLLKITEAGSELLKRAIAFASALDDIGNNLDRSKKNFEEAVTKLKGKQGVLQKAKELESLGVKLKTATKLPARFEMDNDTDIPEIE